MLVRPAVIRLFFVAILVQFIDLSLLRSSASSAHAEAGASLVGDGVARPGSTSGGALDSLKSSVHKVVLSNGLRVVFVRRDIAPVFSGQTWVKVGGVNEIPGKTGASHMLEHMAFKGTTSVGTKDYQKEKPLLERIEALVTEISAEKVKGAAANKQRLSELQGLQQSLGKLWVDNEFSAIYERAGASGLNAGTGKDYTQYTISLPISAFELWCSMESDRILNPVFRQFYKERDVVLEERRMRVEDSPGGMVYEHLLATSYLNHPNRLPVIGWYSDVKGLRTSDVMALHKKYYRPDNIVLSIVGDLDLNQIKPILEKYFSRVPKRTSPLPGVSIVEAPQRGSREVTVEYDAQPQLALGYHKPAYPDPDDSYFAVMHSLLSDGRSSLLYRELVQREKIASAIETSEAPGELFPSLFTVGAYPARGVKMEALRDRIQQIFDGLKTRPIPQDLLAQAKQRVRVGFLGGLSTSDGVASIIGKSELLWDDWAAVVDAYKTMEKTTDADIKRLAEKYLNVRNRTAVYLVRPALGLSQGAGTAGHHEQEK